MIKAGALILLVLGAFAGSAAGAPAAILVVERQDARARKLAGLIAQRLQGRASIRQVEYAETDVGDPIYKGRLVARLESSALVIGVGDDASRFVMREVEDGRLYFVSAVARGAALGEPRVSGVFTYSIDDLLGALPAGWKSELGLLYTPGYEPIVAQIRARSRQLGARLQERRIARAGELPEAARALMASSRAVWVLGDPVLSRGAGFEYLVEQSLSQAVPLIGAGEAQVADGAVLCSRASDAALAAKASRGIAALLAGEKGEARFDDADAGGAIVYNKSLSERFRLSPRSSAWRPLP